ncbi:unnamed protein product [Ophioblennius macclurei]
MEPQRLQGLFSACDLNRSGRIEFEDFTVLCSELGVPESDARTLFDQFDAHRDGYIDFEKFASIFQEVSGTLDLTAFGAAAARTSCGGPGEEFTDKVESLLSESLREQISHLHQAIHSTGNEAVLESYEEMVQSLITQSLDNRRMCEQLETSLKRLEDVNNSQLAELEDEMQQQLCTTEERARSQERCKMEGIMASLQRRHENEVADLHAALDRLSKNQKDLERNTSKDEVTRLNKEIGNLSQENKQLRDSLLQAQTNISVLQSELDKLKNMYADQMDQRDRQTDDLRRMVVEFQSYSSQIRLLQEMNKKLYDSNDDLRSALASEMVAAKRRQLSSQNEIPARRMKPLRQSTFIHSSFEDDRKRATYSRVATWADKYLDSGVSLPMDTAESSASDYDSDDSDDSRSSVETVHHSYSYVPSDVEISEVKSEATVSVTPSRSVSIASSLRRRLSAFSTKPVEADMEGAKEDPQVYRLILAGDAGAGKSSFLLRLTLNEFRGDIPTTLGVDFQMKKMLVDGEKTNLQIWDTAGQERFRSIARSYFRKAHGVLLLYDVGSERSFLNVRAWVDQIQDSAEEKIPMCVIGNKVDLREELPEGRCVSSLQGEKLAKIYGALFCETSAKEGTNVVEAVLHLAREVKKRVTLRQDSSSQLKLNPANAKKNPNNCCGL